MEMDKWNTLCMSNAWDIAMQKLVMHVHVIYTPSDNEYDLRFYIALFLFIDRLVICCAPPIKSPLFLYDAKLYRFHKILNQPL